MNTATRSQYKIWRSRKGGRSLTRWLTDEKVAYYKARFPHWRWQKIQVENRSYQASLQSSQSVYARPRQNYEYSWGRNTPELRESKDFRRRDDLKTISWDDILDVQLALKKGI